jgi:hypothetical protein
VPGPSVSAAVPLQCTVSPSHDVCVLLCCFATADQRQIADGETPLLVASQYGIVEAVDALLASGEAATVNQARVCVCAHVCAHVCARLCVML